MGVELAGVNVRDLEGAGLGAVGLPQFLAVDAIARREVQRVADDGQVVDIGEVGELCRKVLLSFDLQANKPPKYRRPLKAVMR